MSLSNTDIISHTQKVLQTIASKFDIDYDDMFNLVSLEFNFDMMLVTKTMPIETDKTCYAYVNNKKGFCRCARGKTIGNFCKTHHNHFEKGSLPHGYYQPDKITTEAERICIGGKTYLYEKSKKKLYSIPKPNNPSIFIGYLGENNKEIKI